MMEMVKIGEVHFGKRWNNKMGGLGKVCFENLLPLLIHYIDPLMKMMMKILEILENEREQVCVIKGWEDEIGW